MCSVVGAFETRRGAAAPAVLAMLDATAHRGPDGVGVADSRTRFGGGQLDTVRLPDGWGMGHRRLAITGALGDQPMRDCTRSLVVAVNGEIWNHVDLRRRLAGGHRMGQDSDCDVLPHVIEEELRGPDSRKGDSALPEAVAAAVERLDGEYAFAVMDGCRAILVRDPLGVKPMYWGRGGGLVAFASERKALWRIGLDDRRVPPNAVVVLTSEGDEVMERGPVARPGAGTLPDRETAKRAYERAVLQAIEKRVQGVHSYGVVFSGGVDSALVAAVAARFGGPPVCYVAGTPDSTDVAAARTAAAAMGLALRIVPITVDGVALRLPHLLWAVEDRNQLHIETAVPLYFVAAAAAADGLRVLLTGQGPDELMAGYPWYPRVLAQDGETGLRRRMGEDRDLLFKETLEREDKVAMRHGVELRVPLLDPQVVSVAARVPLQWLLDGVEDPLGKRLHREVAEDLGVPARTAWRVKEAAQHGSGTRGVLRDAARMYAPSPRPAAYDAAASLGELVGSSQRYGHIYSGPREWALDAPTQWALDHLALRMGCAGPSEASRLRTYLGSVSAAAPA